jgi:chemotaxis signal transduction protein
MSRLDSATDAEDSGPQAREAQDWRVLARSTAAGAEDVVQEELLELLGLRLGDGSYALPVERVREIVRLRPITRVPWVPEAVLGAVALRGEIVQVIDLRLRLGLAQREATRESRLIILHASDDCVAALLVDAVRHVLRVSEESLQPTQDTAGGFVRELALEDAEFVSIIDVERVLDFDGQ